MLRKKNVTIIAPSSNTQNNELLKIFQQTRPESENCIGITVL